MFDFDNDGDFDLQDIVEADIQYGLFEDDDKIINKPQRKTSQRINFKKKSNNYTMQDIDVKIDLALESLEDVLYSNSYDDSELFQYFCDIADLYEEKFQQSKTEFLQEYQHLFKLAKNSSEDFLDIDTSKLTSIYYEMEDCLFAFDDVLEYEYDFEFEDIVAEYSSRKEQLETELAEYEEMKDSAELNSFDIEPILVSAPVQKSKKEVCKQATKQEKFNEVQYIKPEAKSFSEFRQESNTTEINKEELKQQETTYKEQKSFREMSIREKITHIIVISIFITFGILILVNLPTIFSFIFNAIGSIFKFVWEVIKFIFAAGFLFVVLFIVGAFKLFR